MPRFDRQFGKNFVSGVQGKTDDRGTHYLGLESLASASLTDQFGTVIPQQEACRLILEFSTEPAKDLVEFLKRDLINILFLNSDNHGRNTAFIKRPEGSIRLAPVYDFAPMALDPRGIARLARFPSEHGLAFGLPNYFEEIERAFKWPQSTLRFANTHVLTHAKEQIAEELRSFMTSLAGLDIADLLDACLPRPPEGIAEKIIGSFERRRAYFREV